MNVGIIGCGNISAAYLSLSPLFKDIKIVAVADLNRDAAQARADEFRVRADSVDDLLKATDIDIVVNLTIPAAHFEVSKAILEAGKHVYSEKPFVLTLEEGSELQRLAEHSNLRIGSAPDTFLGGAHQHARQLIDSGAIGTVTSGTAHVMGFGMEHWHPNPDFFYKPGAGPVLDIGPYYVTNLIQLIGPVKRVMAMTSTPKAERVISSQPRAGETVPVETPTTIHSLLEFHNGAIVTLGTSWDVFHHAHSEMELYGEEGTLYVPDPNFFGGQVRITKRDKVVEDAPSVLHPLGIPNFGSDGKDKQANYRTAGLADMAAAIAENRPHRCSMELALHAVDVMTSILRAGETGEALSPTTTCDRPAALSKDDAAALMA